mgnify:CR=1 FL=1
MTRSKAQRGPLLSSVFMVMLATVAVTLLTRWRIPDVAPYVFAVVAVLLLGKYMSREAALDTASVLVDGSQFTINNGLTVKHLQF